MRFTLDIDDKIIDACDAQMKELGGAFPSRNSYIAFVLAAAHDMPGVSKLAEFMEKINARRNELPASRRVARNQRSHA